MNKKRLLKLAEILENIKETKTQLIDRIDKFNMHDWFGKNSCGTSACALGTAALHPWFRRRGLTMQDILQGKIPKYKDSYSFEAGAKFFDISIDESCSLFDAAFYNDLPIKPKNVARKIRNLIAQYE